MNVARQTILNINPSREQSQATSYTRGKDCGARLTVHRKQSEATAHSESDDVQFRFSIVKAVKLFILFDNFHFGLSKDPPLNHSANSKVSSMLS